MREERAQRLELDDASHLQSTLPGPQGVIRKLDCHRVHLKSIVPRRQIRARRWIRWWGAETSELHGKKLAHERHQLFRWSRRIPLSGVCDRLVSPEAAIVVRVGRIPTRWQARQSLASARFVINETSVRRGCRVPAWWQTGTTSNGLTPAGCPDNNNQGCRPNWCACNDSLSRQLQHEGKKHDKKLAKLCGCYCQICCHEAVSRAEGETTHDG